MWVTLSVRVPGLMAGTLSHAERTRMVTEKAEAMVESAQAIGRTTARLMNDPQFSAPTHTAVTAGWLAILEAASRPFHKRVKANAGRLGTPRKRRSS